MDRDPPGRRAAAMPEKAHAEPSDPLASTVVCQIQSLSLSIPFGVDMTEVFL